MTCLQNVHITIFGKDKRLNCWPGLVGPYVGFGLSHAVSMIVCEMSRTRVGWIGNTVGVGIGVFSTWNTGPNQLRPTPIKRTRKRTWKFSLIFLLVLWSFSLSLGVNMHLGNEIPNNFQRNHHFSGSYILRNSEPSNYIIDCRMVFIKGKKLLKKEIQINRLSR